MVRAMFRTALVCCALVAGVTVAAADPRPDDASKTDAKPKHKADPKKQADAKTAKKSAAKKQGGTKLAKAAAKTSPRGKGAKHSSARDSRVPTKTTANNMPTGWAWPPNKAMLASAKGCMAKLDELGIAWTPGEKEGHMIAPIKTDMVFGGVKYSFRFGGPARTLDCHLAVALAAFGKELYGLGVREVKYGSIYRYTKVRVGGQTKNVLSRHALGMAMDITSFVDAAGREAWVYKDYKKGDQLLLDIEKAVNASGKFRLLLTPKNDPISHKDHFHLEANPEFKLDPDDAPVAASDDPGTPDFSDDEGTPDEAGTYVISF